MLLNQELLAHISIGLEADLIPENGPKPAQNSKTAPKPVPNALPAQVVPDRYIKVMGEETTEGLWDAKDQMIFAQDLLLWPETCERLTVWNRWIGDFEDFLPAKRRSLPVFPLDAFNEEGRAITALIQRELPDWTVVYCPLPLEWSIYDEP